MWRKIKENTIYRLIDDLAEKIIEFYKINIPIYDIEEVVKKLGGSIKVDKNLIFNGKLKKDNNSFIIYIPNICKNRSKFIIAHEIGHLVLHTDKFGGIDKKNYTNEEEFEANQFVKALLMPKQEFLYSVKKNTDDIYVNVRNIAEEFDVSISAVINRGKFLEVIKK